MHMGPICQYVQPPDTLMGITIYSYVQPPDQYVQPPDQSVQPPDILMYIFLYDCVQPPDHCVQPPDMHISMIYMRIFLNTMIKTAPLVDKGHILIMSSPLTICV